MYLPNASVLFISMYHFDHSGTVVVDYPAFGLRFASYLSLGCLPSCSFHVLITSWSNLAQPMPTKLALDMLNAISFLVHYLLFPCVCFSSYNCIVLCISCLIILLFCVFPGR